MKLNAFSIQEHLKPEVLLWQPNKLPRKIRSLESQRQVLGIMLSPLHGLQKLKNYLLKWSQISANPFRVSLAETFGAEIIMKEGGVATFAEADRLMRRKIEHSSIHLKALTQPRRSWCWFRANRRSF